MLVSHVFELVTPSPGLDSLPVFLQDTQNLLMFRVFMFSLLPLVLSLRLLAKLGIALDRETLRPVFYSQCFVTAPITLLIGAASAIGQSGESDAGKLIALPQFGGECDELHAGSDLAVDEHRDVLAAAGGKDRGGLGHDRGGEDRDRRHRRAGEPGSLSRKYAGPAVFERAA